MVEKTKWVDLKYTHQDDPPFSRVELKFVGPDVVISGGYEDLIEPFGHPLARLIAKSLENMDYVALFNIFLKDPDSGTIFITINNIMLQVGLRTSDFVELLKKIRR